jgi:hypothetical protein
MNLLHEMEAIVLPIRSYHFAAGRVDSDYTSGTEVGEVSCRIHMFVGSRLWLAFVTA